MKDCGQSSRRRLSLSRLAIPACTSNFKLNRAFSSGVDRVEETVVTVRLALNIEFLLTRIAAHQTGMASWELLEAVSVPGDHLADIHGEVVGLLAKLLHERFPLILSLDWY